MKKSPNTPLVTVIIPCYNGADFVEETIQSALDQTYKNLQIIVVDDGSTDSSATVIKSFSDPRIKYIYQENQGLSAARNTGLRHAKGEYISFLDADDLLLLKKIEHQVNFLENNLNYGLVAQGFIRTDQRGKHLYTSTESARDISLEELIQQSQFPVHTTLIRKDWIDKVGYFDINLKAAEDWDFYCRLRLLGCKMYKQAVAECTYRLLDNAMTTNAPRQTEMLLKVVHKTFASPALPTNLKHLKANAVFQIALMGASRCFVLNFFEPGIIFLKQALQIDTQKIKKLRYELLVRNIAFFTKHMQVPNVDQKAAIIVEKCAVSLPFFAKIKNKLNFHISLSNTSDKLSFVFRSFLKDPIHISRTMFETIVFEILSKKN